MLNAFLGVMTVSAALVGLLVVFPAAVSCGYGLEALLVIFLCFVLRAIFGKEEADKYLEEVEKFKED